MFSFLKVPPTTYVLHYAGGKLKREGAGLSFFYYTPTATIITVPLTSTDAPFVFAESTADFQSVTVQGQLTYRVSDPKRLAGLLDFSQGVMSDAPRKLLERLVQSTQSLTRTVTQRMNLREVLVSSDQLREEVLNSLKQSEAVTTLGVEVLGLTILGIKPTPEMAKALEAEAREALQRRSDEAIYARRNAAVEQERLIKESELNTQIAVEEKQRQIRETKMAAEIAVEEQRAKLVDHRVENERKDADSRAYALEQILKPIRQVDWRSLMLMNGGSADARTLIAMAFQDLAGNAQKIGELNISPDLLQSLLAANRK